MAISALIFSRDRPAQLDLLLRSMKQRASLLAAQTTVLWRASSDQYEQGYADCAAQHKHTIFREEQDFARDVNDLLKTGADCWMALCDDDVFWRSMQQIARPDDFLLLHPDVLTVSLRLGYNTVDCYPLRRKQVAPSFEFRSLNVWGWRGADGDWSYPGSLDGNVWRRDQLRVLLRGDGWASPNELEDQLNLSCQKTLLPLMGCYDKSFLVGVPVNSVQTVYDRNRHGETHSYGVADLNERFLRGGRLALPSPKVVDGAHMELPLEWMSVKAVA